jgi:hypothetical protein
LVVVATALATADSGETRKFEGMMDYTGVNTKLRVEAFLKGKIEARTITVRHFRRPKDESATKNAPPLVVFRLEPLEIEVSALGPSRVALKGSLPLPQYLLFLKRLQDGRYEPVSGQDAPDESIRELYKPLFRGIRLGDD